jgi:hypothetical protein
MPQEATPVDRPTVIRARLARAVRFGASAEALDSLRRDYHAARQAERLREWLASDPAPSPEHRAELAALLVGGDADATAA